jgi:hypothetical protein
MNHQAEVEATETTHGRAEARVDLVFVYHTSLQ